MKKILVLTAALLALGSVASVTIPSFAQDTTNASGEQTGNNQNTPSKAEGGGGNGGDLCDASSSMAATSSSMDCPASSSAM